VALGGWTGALPGFALAQQSDSKATDASQTQAKDDQAKDDKDQQDKNEREKAQAIRETKRGTIEDARDTTRQAREGARDTAREDRSTTRDAREGARDTAREDRGATRDARESSRDTAREDRDTIREARRDTREARREFRSERLRSGDLGLWLRRAANRLTVADIAGRGAISQTGLKDGDEIVSVNGQKVTSERDFIDQMFKDPTSTKPVEVVVNRNGQQQTVSLQPKLFVDEHLANDNRLHEYGILLDENDPNHVTVQAIVPRSPAFYAGMRRGDRITGFRGQKIQAVTDLVRAISNAASGGLASVEVNRNNQTRQLDIEVPGQSGDEARTALRPTLPSSSSNQAAPSTAAPSTATPSTTVPRTQPVPPADTRPKLNPNR
jgi:C-terminal processing protease CtpA/Prc